jgi:chemotaxis protein histidine kinase CheA
MTITPSQVNGTHRPAPSVDWTAATDSPQPDPVAEAEAAAIRSRTYAETEAARVKAEAEAEAIRTRTAAEAEERRIKAEAEAAAALVTAEAEAEKQQIANRRAAMKLQADELAHAKRIAELKAQTAAAESAAEKTRKDTEAEAEREADREAEQQRSESLWKWGARGIYAVGLLIAAPVQFLDFWDKKRPFLVAAPVLLEGLALVLACGAAWAVAHRRDVMPYRVGIMIGALIAATINMRGGMTNPAIGFNAGLIGAIASLGGPIVLMAYEHGIAQKVDGIPSYRERRATDKEKAAEAAARAKAKADKKAAEDKAAAEKSEQQKSAEAEQKRRDDDRREHHPEVWEVAEALRSARGVPSVTEQIWGDAWYRVTGSKVVGVTPEIEAQSRDALARMKAASDGPVEGLSSLVESQMPSRPKRDPDAPDARRFNGGVPPLRRAGDSAPYHPAAGPVIAETARRASAARDTEIVQSERASA